MAQRSFKDAYGVLQKHAETLRDQDEPNIDDLLTIVTESVDAYKVCKERIDAVEAALKAALDGTGVGAATPGSAATERAADAPATRTASSARPGRAAPPPSGFESGDDDIPF
ncbi:exodeoxyribonuclease VII small subunit [Variovorax sp. GB1R11]|uniref:exodeoxyribonuclease VII small subunit n=1 Tax=Variovorax sp. GB1R11 TaxID=3443741 RepID=UPI003F475D19